MQGCVGQETSHFICKLVRLSLRTSPSKARRDRPKVMSIPHTTRSTTCSFLTRVVALVICYLCPEDIMGGPFCDRHDTQDWKVIEEQDRVHCFIQGHLHQSRVDVPTQTFGKQGNFQWIEGKQMIVRKMKLMLEKLELFLPVQSQFVSVHALLCIVVFRQVER